MAKRKTAFILGAGFSANAGLPLQSGFTQLFLKANEHKKGKSRLLMPDLGEFVEKTFGFSAGAHEVQRYPELEDVFTTIDMSANTGHHLGPKYSAHELRRLRRMLLSRIIRMLNSAYLDGKDNPTNDRERLLSFVKMLDPERHKIISLNWDTVLEGCLEELHSKISPYYSREIQPSLIENEKLKVLPRPKNALLIAKMHGSINWLYCDCCRRTFSVPVKHVFSLASQVLKNVEAHKLYKADERPRLTCPKCAVDLSVRLATFSYQKALRTPMFESSWLEAEKALRGAKRWVFVGYSLPSADFEFKYLLKRVCLARSSKPEIVVITKNERLSQTSRPDAALSYRRFLGECKLRFFRRGISGKALKEIFDA